MKTAILFAPLLFAACATTPAGPVADPGQTCRGEALAQFVGQPASQGLGARMLRESGAKTLRWVDRIAGHAVVQYSASFGRIETH